MHELLLHILILETSYEGNAWYFASSKNGICQSQKDYLFLVAYIVWTWDTPWCVVVNLKPFERTGEGGDEPIDNAIPN